MKKRRLLDSFAVLSWLRDEPGAPLVEELLAEAKASHERLLLHEVNLAEDYLLSLDEPFLNRMRAARASHRARRTKSLAPVRTV